MERCRFTGPVDHKKDWRQPTIAGRSLKPMSHGSISFAITFIKIISAPARHGPSDLFNYRPDQNVCPRVSPSVIGPTLLLRDE